MIRSRSWPVAQRALDYYRAGTRDPMPYLTGLTTEERGLFHGLTATLRGGRPRTPDETWAEAWGLLP